MTTAYTTLLGLALPVQGELTGTWGTEVNNSITQLLDDAIAGTATASVTSGDWTLTDTGSGVPNQARCAILIATGTPGVSRNIIAPARSKGYFVVNQSDAAVVLKGVSTTGISVPTNKSALVVWNGSDFVTAVSPSSNGTVTTVSVASANGFTGSVSNPTSTPAITLTTSISGVLKGNGTAISAATSGTDYSAGTSALATGILKSTTSTGALTIAVAGDFPTLNQNTTGTAANLTAATTLPSGMTLVAPILGTPASGTLTSCTGLPLTTGVTGTLPITNGGTGTATPALVAGTNVTITGTWPNQTINASGGGGGSGTVTSVSGTGSVNGISLSGTVTSSGSLTLGGTLSNVSLTTQVSGTLPVANGGTGTTTPSLTGGTGISISGTWPNQTVTASGGASLTGITSGNIVALGVNAYNGISTATFNTAIGYYALNANGAGTDNTAIGNKAMQIASGSSANANVAVGSDSLKALVNAGSNTAVGYGALTLCTGSSNTGIGSSALYNNTSGGANVGVGAGAALSSGTVSNEVNIYNGTTTARFQGGASSWSFVSDQRDKSNIADLNLGLSFITKLQPRTFEWNFRHTEVDRGKLTSGFIAQEVLTVMESENAMYTHLVDTNDPEQYTLAQTNLIPMLVNAIKELTARLEILENK
jgi:hypothetical protein